MAYYRQPKFFSSFKCMGGSCPSNCCRLWRIDWMKKEIDKLKAADCSPELRQLINDSFTPYSDTDQLMLIKLNEQHECPFLTEDRMCRIQRELGEEYISNICAVFPRMRWVFGDMVYQTCATSCYAAMKTICTEPDAMQLYSAPMKEPITIYSSQDTPETLKKHPELHYRHEMFEFFYEIIGNKKRSLETSLVLGALAAQKLNEYIALGQHERIPEIIKALRPQLNAQTVPSFENAKPNYAISLGITGKIVEAFETSNILDVLKEGDKLSVDKYLHGRSKFDSFNENNPHVMRNLALNFLFEGRMPYYNTDFSLFENYCYYVATIASIRTIICAVAHMNKDIINGLCFTASYFTRAMFHAYNRSPKRIISILEEYNCNSPSFLALMLK